MKTNNIYLNGHYLEKNPSLHSGDSRWKTTQIVKMITQNGLQPKTIGDIGCGAGEILKQLQLFFPKQARLSGYDISPHAIAICKSKANEWLQFYNEDLLTLETEPFDLLLCIDVFEHIEDYMGFLRKLRMKAADKIFHIPLDMSVQILLRNHIPDRRNSVGHLHYFSKDSALLTLKDTGYQIVDWFYTPVSNELGKKWITKMVIWPRKLLSLINQDLTVRILGGYSLMVLAK